MSAPSPLVRAGAYAATLLALVGLVTLVPRDACGASMTGACVVYDLTPFHSRVAVGETAELTGGTMTVLRVTTTDWLRVGTKAHSRPDVVFVAARVRGAAARTAAGVELTLHIDERRFTPVEQVQLTFRPGFTTEGVAVFRLPRDVIDRPGVLHAEWSASVGEGVRIDLGELRPIARHTEAVS